MKNASNNPTRKIFSIAPLPIIALTLYFLAGNFHFTYNPRKDVSTTIQATTLPCGFVATGPKQKPEDPTFLTNNAVPVLQCPAGGYPGTSAQIPDAVYSAHKNDQIILQSDGNLVIYCMTCSPAKALWSSRTNGKGATTLFFQSDGDLVLKNASGKVIWHSNIHSTCDGSDKAYFTLQDDGNFAMLYNIVGTQAGSPSAGNSGDYTINTYYLGGTATTNNQASTPHPGKIQ